MNRNHLWSVIIVVLLSAVFAFSACAEELSFAERVDALKTTVLTSQENLRQYEWIETSVVSVKGEEKSRKQERCYYGSDGKLQKVLVTKNAPEASKPGIRGMIAKNKKAEMTDYMKEAVNLVRSYVPLDPGKIEAVKAAGKVTFQLTEPGRRARMVFIDYQKTGDNLAIDLDLVNNSPFAMSVQSFLKSPKEPVTLNVSISALNDGTIYVSNAVLNAKEKNLKVTIENSGYRRMLQ